MKKKWVLRHCDLDLWPKVTNFNRVGANVVSYHLAKTSVQISSSVRLEFCSQAEPDRHTDRQTDREQWKYNRSTISWRYKKIVRAESRTCMKILPAHRATISSLVNRLIHGDRYASCSRLDLILSWLKIVKFMSLWTSTIVLTKLIA